MIQVLPIAVIALGLAACVKIAADMKGNSTLSSLAGSEWGPMDGSDQFVQFKTKGELAGSGGCNSFFGTYEQNGERLIVGPLASTKKACPPDIMQRETDFLARLQNTHHITATHRTLILRDKNGDEIATLRRRDWD